MIVLTASNKHQEVKLANTRMMLNSGVSGVGESVEIRDGTQEIHTSLRREYLETKRQNARSRKWMYGSRSQP